MHSSKIQNIIGAGVVGCLAAVVSGCGDSSTAVENRNQIFGTSQAIDGFIVNGAVYCDGERNGRTEAAGRFDCPVSTNVSQVRGGTDVGFDETATSGGIPFAGELKGPAGTPFVTPLSTLATNIATTNGVFDSSQYEGAVDTLAESLDLVNLDLSVSPIDDVRIAKAGAKINQLIVNFSDSTDEYSVVAQQLSNAIAADVPLSLTADTSSIVSALNERLVVAAPELSVSASRQAAIAQALEETNAAIDQSASAREIGDIIEEENGGAPFVFTIDRSAPLVRFGDPADQSTPFFSLGEFENSSLGPFGYTVVNRADSQIVEFATTAFDVSQSVTNAEVDLAIEFTSTDLNDERHISIIMYGASLSMTEGFSDSVQISVPDDALLFAQAMDEAGVVTNITTSAGDDYFATNANGNFSFAFSTLNSELADRGYHNFTQESGNYEVTMVISGLGFGIKDSATSVTDPSVYSISTATRTVSGNGLNGFFTTQ